MISVFKYLCVNAHKPAEVSGALKGCAQLVGCVAKRRIHVSLHDLHVTGVYCVVSNIVNEIETGALFSSLIFIAYL